jgi:hypothetical protein
LLRAATVRKRERNRHDSRQLARRVIGSTMLLKGLEAEAAVIPSHETWMPGTSTSP